MMRPSGDQMTPEPAPRPSRTSTTLGRTRSARAASSPETSAPAAVRAARTMEGSSLGLLGRARALADSDGHVVDLAAAHQPDGRRRANPVAGKLGLEVVDAADRR